MIDEHARISDEPISYPEGYRQTGPACPYCRIWLDPAESLDEHDWRCGKCCRGWDAAEAIEVHSLDELENHEARG